MNTQEATIEVLQNRIKYLEANLRLALQVLNNIEQESLDSSSVYSSRINSPVDSYSQGKTIEVIATDKIALPTFLNSRTWKQQNSQQLLAKAS